MEYATGGAQKGPILQESSLKGMISNCTTQSCCGCPMQVKVIQSDMRKRAREEISLFQLFVFIANVIKYVQRLDQLVPFHITVGIHLCCKLSGLASSVAALHLAFPALTFMHCYGSLAGQTLPHLRVWPARPFCLCFLAVWE